jgi:hypothetical protein
LAQCCDAWRGRRTPPGAQARATLPEDGEGFFLHHFGIGELSNYLRSLNRQSQGISN